MLPYYLKCRKKQQKKTESKNPQFAKTKNRRIMPLSKWEVCVSKKSEFNKKQEVSGLLSSLGIKVL